MAEENEEVTLKDSFVELEEVCDNTVDLFHRIYDRALKKVPETHPARQTMAMEIAKQLCPKPMEIVAWLMTEDDEPYDFDDEYEDLLLDDDIEVDDDMLKKWAEEHGEEESS